MRDRLDDLLGKLRWVSPGRPLAGLETRVFLEIRRRNAQHRQVREELRRNLGIAAVALIVGLGAGLYHTVLSAAPQPQKINLLLTGIPAAALIE